MTTQQKILHDFVANNYASLSRRYPQRDMLHSAYIAVHDISIPLCTDTAHIEQLLSDAYYRYLQRELQYQARFTLPDPLFWFYRETLSADPEDERITNEAYQQCNSRELSARDLRALRQFIHYHCSTETYRLFVLAFCERHTLPEIARILGKSRRQVSESLTEIEQLIAEKYHKFNTKTIL